MTKRSPYSPVPGLLPHRAGCHHQRYRCGAGCGAVAAERAVHQQEIAAGQLQVALNSRVMIEQAKGILAERLQTTPDEAFVALRRHARSHNHALTQLAADVIGGTVSIPAS